MNENNSLAIPTNYEKALTQTADYYNTMTMFVKLQMQRDLDYGVIPGTNKPCLFKTGAEKLCRLFNLRPNFSLIQSVVDFDKPLFHYHYRCSLYRGGEMVGDGDGCCNSMEIKYQKQKHFCFRPHQHHLQDSPKTRSNCCCFSILRSKRVFYSGFRSLTFVHIGAIAWEKAIFTSAIAFPLIFIPLIPKI